jgi:hypothetical protein
MRELLLKAASQAENDAKLIASFDAENATLKRKLAAMAKAVADQPAAPAETTAAEVA